MHQSGARSGDSTTRRAHVVLTVTFHHHHHLFAQNTTKIDNGYVNEQDRKAHCALTSAHNIYVDCGTQYT